MTVRNDEAAARAGASFAGVRRGFAAVTPMALVVVPFGMSFGVAATERDVPAWVAMVMSMTVMAGGAQFAAIDLWHVATPVVPIAVTVLAVNSRHLLFGASLGQWLSRFRPPSRSVAIGVISDPSWALTDRAVREGEDDLGFLLGCGGGLWAGWAGGTALGLVVGDALGDRFVELGLDTLLITYFAALLVPLWSGRGSVLPWAAAAIIAIWGRTFLPEGWNVLAAALGGGVLAALVGFDDDGATA